MSRFNQKTSTEPVYNDAGGKAYRLDPKIKLVNIITTSMVKDQFYKGAKQNIKEIEELIHEIPDKKFVAKAAIFTRNEYGMRSISHLVAGELSKHVKGQTWTKSFYDRVVKRVDDITEIISYVVNKFGKPIPNALKKGLAKAFDKFDMYQLSKYKAENKDIKLVDAVNLLHPKPTEKNREALKLLVEGNLKQTETWEAKQSKAGQAKDEKEKKELKQQTWNDLILNKKIGYLALLKNLNNIVKDSPGLKREVISSLTNEKLIKNSLVLPFRFQTAIKNVKDADYIMALSQAMDISLSNVPSLPGKTLIVLDTSGSMTWESNQSGMSAADIGGLFAAVLLKSNDSELITFGSWANYQILNKLDTVSTIAKNIKYDGGSTNFNSIFQTANKPYDRVIILSDMQGWVENGELKNTFNSYRKRYSCNPKLYTWDLTGSSTSMFPSHNIYCLSGFSDKVFDMIALLEQDPKAMIKKIEAIEL